MCPQSQSDQMLQSQYDCVISVVDSRGSELWMTIVIENMETTKLEI